MPRSSNITSYQDLADWLDSLGYFGSVTYAGGTITLKDESENTLATVSSSGVWTLYADEGRLSANVASGIPPIGITCEHGAVLYYALSSGIPTKNKHFLIAKNQEGAVVFAWHDTAQQSSGSPYYYDTGYRACTWKDGDIGAYQTDQRLMNQTLLVPICTRPKVGNVSFCPDAFMLYTTETQTAEKIRIGGTLYYSTGWFAIRDDGGAT